MERFLLVSSAQKGGELLIQLLRERNPHQIVTAASGGEARRALAEQTFSLLLINAPLSDEFGHDLALTAARTTSAGVLLLVKHEHADEVSARVESAGVLVVPKPVNRVLLYQAIRLAEAARNRLLGLQQEKETLESKIQEIRLVDRAKCALIQYLSMTEPQAHRYIEKEAMDRRVTRREVAEGILQTYEA